MRMRGLEPADQRSAPPRGRAVWLIDTTLRDGAQAPGVAFTPAQRVGLAESLASIGIDEIEVGCPAMGEAERATIRQTVGLGLGCRLTAWCRARPEDLDAAAACGLAAAHLSVPGSGLQLKALDKSWAWVRRTLTELVPRARRRFAFVSVGVMDASRTESGRVAALARLCADLGADRLRLADTVGVWNPRSAARAVRDVAAAAPGLAVGVHAHNDLGMAVGNTLAALEAGAASADTTVLGLGERAGNAPLEELVMALRATTDLGCRVAPRGLAALCRQAAECAGRTIHPSKPVVGPNAFRHESGVHVRGMLRDARCFEPFAPEAVGRRDRQLALGTHGGRGGLAAALQAAGLRPDENVIDALLHQVREEAAQTRRSVSPQRAAALHEQLRRPPAPATAGECASKELDACVA